MPPAPALRPLPLAAALPVAPLAAISYGPQSLVPFLGLCFFLFSGKLANNNTRDLLSFVLVLIGLMGGAVTELNLALLMGKRARVIGSTLRARPISEKAAVMDQLLKNVWPDIESGAIQPVIEAEYPIQQAAEAHSLMASNNTIGKIVLTV